MNVDKNEEDTNRRCVERERLIFVDCMYERSVRVKCVREECETSCEIKWGGRKEVCGIDRGNCV
jgi:hypothetical protein